MSELFKMIYNIKENTINPFSTYQSSKTYSS